jgi:hypothetical protein
VIGFQAKGVSLVALNLTIHEASAASPLSYRRRVSLHCILSSLIARQSPRPAKQDVRVAHHPLVPTSSKPLSTLPASRLEPFISSLERSFEAGVSRQHCHLLGRTYCEISCLSPWYRLAALLHRGRSEPFLHSRFVPIQSNQRY